MQSNSEILEPLKQPISHPLISSLVDSHVKMSASQEKEKELMEKEADYGKSTYGSFAKLDQDGLSWKTSQACFLTEWALYLETWPRAGMMRNGIVFRQVPLAPLNNETEFGYWPTPNAVDYKGGSVNPLVRAKRDKAGMNNLRDFMAKKGNWLYPPARVVECLMGLPIGWGDLKCLETAKTLTQHFILER